ncbi:MAG: DNA repair protein RecO [Acidobacteriota bacterium]
MQLFDAPALVLDVIDLQERDRIVVFLTAEHGTKRGVARGARTKFSRFAGQLLPLAKVRVTWAEKPGRELVRISDVQTLRPAAPIQEQLESLLLGSYLAEHMVELVHENDPSSAWFRLLDSSIEALLEGIDPMLVGRYFEVWALRLSGVLPVPRDCPLCGQGFEERGGAALLESEGAVVCAACAAGQRHLAVGAGELAFLRRSGSQNLRQMADDPPPSALLARLEQLAAHVRRHFLQKELRSYRVMRSVLAS